LLREGGGGEEGFPGGNAADFWEKKKNLVIIKEGEKEGKDTI